MTKTRKNVKRKKFILVFLFILLIAVAGLSYYLYLDYNRRVNASCIMEVGDTVSADLLAQSDTYDVSFVSLNDFNSDVCGTYDVTVKSGLFTYDCQIMVVDTTPPTGTVNDVDIKLGDKAEATDFFSYTFDASPITVAYVKEPDFTKAGQQSVSLVITDAADNATTYDATLTIHEPDSEPPVFHGASDFTIYVGETISYKNRIDCTDNIDGDISFDVDGVVDNNTPGEYPVTLKASDWAGNTATADIVVTVIEAAYSQEEIDALADEVLAKIITDDMSDLDKVNAIYNYVTANIGYLEHSDKGDWIKAAYEGLAKHQGDCYVYASTSKELLTRAGIKNRDIEIIPTATRHHYWNLVDIGEGWHHFDTTPRHDHPRLCYLTDEELMAYSDAHYHSHNYDRTIYNDIP